MSGFSHFKGGALTRSEKLQRQVVELVLDSSIPESKRESSAIWELKHSSSCAQIGRLLAMRRGLDVELAEVACALHDVASVVTGEYAAHGPRGALIARELLEKTGGFSKAEVGVICRAIHHHSEKDVQSGDPFIELVKDADVLDCSLYQGARALYFPGKPKPVFDAYVRRIHAARVELGLKPEPAFRP
jgi:uncharacterized protein